MAVIAHESTEDVEWLDEEDLDVTEMFLLLSLTTPVEDKLLLLRQTNICVHLGLKCRMDC